jgi:hypothetical protein
LLPIKFERKVRHAPLQRQLLKTLHHLLGCKEGYLSHTDTAVRLYLHETFTFLLLTTEAAVALAPPAKA